MWVNYVNLRSIHSVFVACFRKNWICMRNCRSLSHHIHFYLLCKILTFAATTLITYSISLYEFGKNFKRNLSISIQNTCHKSWNEEKMWKILIKRQTYGLIICIHTHICRHSLSFFKSFLIQFEFAVLWNHWMHYVVWQHSSSYKLLCVLAEFAHLKNGIKKNSEV